MSSQQRAIPDVALICEMDEQWGWVSNKRQQHWLFYGFDIAETMNCDCERSSAEAVLPKVSSSIGTLSLLIFKLFCSTKRKKVLAHVFGPRTTETLRRLLQLLKKFSIGMFTTDGWPSYQQHLPQPKHLVGKIFTQRIERHNLTLRTPIKRLARHTICFSNSIEIHEKVIGAYIDKFHYQSL